MNTPAQKPAIRVGILGAGRIGQVHINALAEQQRALVCVADPYMNDELDALIRAKGVQSTSKSAEDIFDNEDIDAVFICSPTDTHSDFSLAAIEKKKHVFCEKPVDMDIKRILEVERALEQMPEGTNLVYQVGFNRRFDHNFMAAKRAIDEKKIGVPRMIRITSRDPTPPPMEYIRSSGGLFQDMMIHDFDMARFLTGSDIAEVFAYGGVLVDPTIGEAGDVDSAVVSLRFENGMIGYIENCRQSAYGYDQRVEIHGAEGAVSIGNDSESTAVVSSAQGVSGEKPLLFFLERYHDAYKREQVAFFDSIQRGSPAVCGIKEGLESVKLAYAAKKSLDEHRPVALSEIGTRSGGAQLL